MLGTIYDVVCPACAHQVAIPFLDGGEEPLATLSWPETSKEAKEMPRFPLDFIRCVCCGHIFNRSFDYTRIPYSRKPNLMYNQGPLWSQFIDEILERICELLPERPIVVEIGHGDGSFLTKLAKRIPDGRFVGFDPHGGGENHGSVQFRKELFDPARHLAEYRPDILVSRHVLEHLANPLKFMQQIAFVAASLEQPLLTYFEVPCVDNALRDKRSVDFYYEHNSQFTSSSFSRMMQNCSTNVLEIDLGYDSEVVFSLARLGDVDYDISLARETKALHEEHKLLQARMRRELDALYATRKSVVFWGGTGKSAAFFNRYGVDADRFPVVIDSDRQKVGTYVPGCGQRIESTDWFQNHSADVVVIPPKWRAVDICIEIQGLGLTDIEVLIEMEGWLVPFILDEGVDG